MLAGSLTDVANPNLHDSNLNAPEAPAGPDDVVTNNVALYLLTFSHAGTVTLSSGTTARAASIRTSRFRRRRLHRLEVHAHPVDRDDFTWCSPVAVGTYGVAISACENFSFAENQGTGTLGDGFILSATRDFHDGPTR